MPDDDQRAADLLEEIRDLLIEMRDSEIERAEESRQQIEESWRIQQAAFKRQKTLQLVGLVLLVPVLFYLLWAILREM